MSGDTPRLKASSRARNPMSTTLRVHTLYQEYFLSKQALKVQGYQGRARRDFAEVKSFLRNDVKTE